MARFVKWSSIEFQFSPNKISKTKRSSCEDRDHSPFLTWRSGGKHGADRQHTTRKPAHGALTLTLKLPFGLRVMSQSVPTVSLATSRRGRRRRRNVTGKKGVRDAEVRGFVNAAEACGQVRTYRTPNSRSRHLLFPCPTSLAPGIFDAALRATHPTSPGSRPSLSEMFGVFPSACLSFSLSASQPYRGGVLQRNASRRDTSARVAWKRALAGPRGRGERR